MHMTTRVNDPIELFLHSAGPSRFVWRGERRLVTSATPEEIDYLPTCGSVVSSWSLVAQTEAGVDAAQLHIRRAYGGGEIDTAVFS